MAGDKKIELVLELKNGQWMSSVRESAAATKKFKQDVEASTSGIAGGFNKMYNAAKAYIGLQVAKYFLNLAGTFDDVKSSFVSLTSSLAGGSDGLLKSIQTAAQGTVSQLDIMKSSNLAITLMGENVAENLPRMMEIARSTAATQGVSVSQMYNDIIVASGRQSVMILDNLGISSVTAGKYMEEYARKLGKTRDKLDDTQKRAAFFYAVMQAGGDIVDKTGSGTLSLGQRIQILKARGEDTATMLTEKLVPGLESVFTVLSDPMDGEESIIGFIGNALNDLLVVIARFIQGLRNMPAAARQTWKDLKAVFLTDNKTSMDLFARNREQRKIEAMSPSEAARYIKENKERLKSIDFGDDYLDASSKMFQLESGYSKYNRGKKSTGGKAGRVPGASSASDPEAAKKQYDEQKKVLEKFRQYGMSEYEKIQVDYEKDNEEYSKINDEKLKKTKEYSKAREAIEKKHQDSITKYIISSTQKWLSFGSDALSGMANIYNMIADNKIKRLDEEYAKQVDVINNSTASEETKAAKLAQLEAKYEADKKRVQLANAKSQKKITLTQAIISSIQAVMKTWETFGWPWGIFPAGTMAGIGFEQVNLIRKQPIALAEGGLATRAAYAMIGEGRYYEAVLPLSKNTFRQMAEQQEVARLKLSSVKSSQPVIQNHYYQFSGSYYDKEGLNKAIYDANREMERRSGVTVYSRSGR